MAGKTISRREIVSGLSAGATAALTGATVLAASPALAQADRRQYTATAGPCSLWPGHTMSYQVFLPAVQRGGIQSNQFRLILKTIDGKVLLTHDFEVPSGGGKEIKISFRPLADSQTKGGLFIDDAATPAAIVDLLVVIAIIAILIGLLLPAVQSVQATSTSFVPIQSALQNVNYVLPFVEQ